MHITLNKIKFITYHLIKITMRAKNNQSDTNIHKDIETVIIMFHMLKKLRRYLGDRRNKIQTELLEINTTSLGIKYILEGLMTD